MSGSAVRSHDQPKTGRVSSARRITSYLLSFKGYPPILDAFRLQHRCHRTFLLKEAEVASRRLVQSPEIPNQNKPRDDKRNSKDSLADLSNGWRSSLIISKIQKYMHPHTVLMIQIRNVLQKWHSGSTVFKNSLPKRPKLGSLLANQNDKGSLHKTHWRSSTSGQKSVVT